MAQKINGFERLWKELKRRKVIHVITVYAAVSFVILQLVDIVERPLRLPDWTTALVIVLVCIGFIIAVFLSWVYDITPAGVKKTKPVSSVKHIDQTTMSTSSGWKIATYASGVIIIGLVVFNFISRRSLNTDISKIEKTIAVLPFRNDSRDTSNTYFINGLMEEIVFNLQKIGAFSRVLSRNSVEQYRNNTTKSTPEIAKELGVNYIVEGSGQKYGNSYRLRVQLIAGKNERHLWADSYEKEIKETKDIYNTQSEVAKSIASALKTAITPEEKQLIEKTPTANLTANDFYQRGREEHTKYWLDNTNSKALGNAISYYELALKNDSTLAQAYSGLAMAYVDFYWKDVIVNRIFSENDLKIYKDSIISLTDKALFYNKDLEEAYFVLGDYYYRNEDYDMALKEYKKTLEINPNYGLAYNAMSNIFFSVKKLTIEGIKYKLKSIELERGPILPLRLEGLGTYYEVLGLYGNAIDIYNQILELTNDSLEYFKNMSGPYWCQKKWEESISWAERILEKDSDNYWAHDQLAGIYFYLGQNDLSSYHVERMKELGEKRSFYAGGDIEIKETYFLLQHGEKKQAQSIIDQYADYLLKLTKSGTRDYGGNFISLAKIFSMKGEYKKALEYLNKFNYMMFQPTYYILDVEMSPIFHDIKSNEQFQEILNTMKSNWQKEHDKVRIWLEENNLLKI